MQHLRILSSSGTVMKSVIAAVGDAFTSGLQCCIHQQSGMLHTLKLRRRGQWIGHRGYVSRIEPRKLRKQKSARGEFVSSPSSLTTPSILTSGLTTGHAGIRALYFELPSTVRSCRSDVCMGVLPPWDFHNFLGS